MRALLAVIVIAAAGWAGYWWLGATAAQSGFAAWFDARRADGWAADAADITVSGFPNRFDTTFTDITLADPATGWAWQAPFFQLFALSYQPNHIIAAWPNSQTLATPRQTYQFSSTSMQASGVLGADATLPLERANLVADTLAITDEADAVTAMTALRLAIERTESTAATYHLGLAADNLAPPRTARTRLDRQGQLPQTFSAFRADITASFDKPWDRRAIEQARPQPRQITVTLAEARWGDLELAVAGALDVDTTGQPSGRLTVKARNWRDIVQLARASGQLPPGLADQVETALSMLAQLSGNSQTLDIPLDFRNGRVFMGPVPIAAAPILRLR